MTCGQCGYDWRARVERPKECPQCKSRAWQSEGGGNGRRTPTNGAVVEPGAEIYDHAGSNPALRTSSIPDCPDCGKAMLENRKLRKWMCACGYQEPL